MTEKESIKPTGRGGKRPGSGRPKGALDEGNAALRELILGALGDLGGKTYLIGVAQSHPTAFMSLLGKVLPTTLEGPNGGPIQHGVTFEVIGVSPQA